MKKTMGKGPKRTRKSIPNGYLDFIKVLTGTVSRGLMRGIFKIMVAGFLAPRAMGILRSIYSLFKLVGNLTDMGLDYTLIRFVSPAVLNNQPNEKEQILRNILSLRILIASGVLIFGNLFAEEIAIWVLCDPDLTIYVRLAFIGITGRLLWKYISSYLSAHQKFTMVAFFLATLPFIMLVWGLILVMINRFSLPTTIMVYLFAPSITGLLWLPVLKRGFWHYPFLNKKIVRRILRFSRWIFLGDMASAVRGHAGTLLLKNTRLSGSLSAGESAAGQYSFGSDLAGGMAMISGALMMVMLPKATGKQNIPALKRFVGKAYKNMIIWFIPMGTPLFLMKPFILMLGRIKSGYLQYLPSYEVFVILYVAGLFSMAVLPMRTVLYAVDRPHIETYTEFIAAGIIIIGSITLIPEYGYNGAAMAVLVQRIISFVVIFGYGFSVLRRPESET